MINFTKKNIQFHRIEFPVSDELISEANIPLCASLFNASQKRKDEYIAGRICAQKAALSVGVEVKSLPKTKSGPLWPKQIVGSISHSKLSVISAVALSVEYKSLGLDIEKVIDQKRVETIKKTVLTGKESERFLDYSDDELYLILTVIFSAKESLFKLINPFAKCYFGMMEAQVNWVDQDENTFEIELISENEKLANYKKKYQGEFQLDEQEVLTLLYLKC